MVQRQSLGRAFQRTNAPGGDLVHVDVEGRLIELDDIDAVGLQRARLLVEQFREGHRQGGFVAVVPVRDRIDDRHRTRQGEFQFSRGVRAGQPRLGCVHAAGQPQRAGDRRHHRLVAIVANAHLDLVGEVDALDALQEAVHEVLARLFAVGNDVDAGVFLQFQP